MVCGATKGAQSGFLSSSGWGRPVQRVGFTSCYGPGVWEAGGQAFYFVGAFPHPCAPLL